MGILKIHNFYPTKLIFREFYLLTGFTNFQNDWVKITGFLFVVYFLASKHFLHQPSYQMYYKQPQNFKCKQVEYYKSHFNQFLVFKIPWFFTSLHHHILLHYNLWPIFAMNSCLRWLNKGFKWGYIDFSSQLNDQSSFRAKKWILKKYFIYQIALLPPCRGRTKSLASSNSIHSDTFPIFFLGWEAKETNTFFYRELGVNGTSN